MHGGGRTTLYEEIKPSKTNNIGEDSKYASHVSKIKGVKSNTPNSSDKSCAGKHRKFHLGHPSDGPNGVKICFVWHTEYQCKILAKYQFGLATIVISEISLT